MEPPLSKLDFFKESSELKREKSGEHACREVVSFGDSMEERTAVQIVSEQLSAIPKSAMLLSFPTPTQILGQLAMLTSQMGYVCNHSDSLDLEMSPNQALKRARYFWDEEIANQ